MFRIIKLAVYVAVGYMLYEFFQGLKVTGALEGMGQQGGGQQRGQQGGGQRQQGQRQQGQGQQRQQGQRGQQGQRSEQGAQQSNPSNMTGPGEGRRVQVNTGEEGAGHSERVGRGVVR